MPVDFSLTAGDYATHRAGFPDEFFDRLEALGLCAPGRRALDLGTGTGSVARGLARRGCDAVALDPGRALVDQARLLDRDAGVAVAYVLGRAEQAPLGSGAFDMVTAGQCWHWFERGRAASECHRLLSPGGALAICHFDWIPFPGNVADATEALVVRHNPQWPGAGSHGMYPRWARDVAGAGFGGIETFSFDTDVPYSHEAWRGRVRACAGVAASLGPDAVAAFDAEHARMLSERFPAEPLAVPHRLWALVARREP